MSSVSPTVLEWLADVLGDAELAAELRPPGSAGGGDEPPTPIAWERVAALLERLEARFPSREALCAAAQRCASERFARAAASLPGGFSHPRQLYWAAHRWLRREHLPSLEGHHEELPDGRIRISAALPAGSADAAPLFEVLRGVLMSVPVLLGEAPAAVAAEVTGRGAVFTITPPSRPRDGVGGDISGDPGQLLERIARSSPAVLYVFDIDTSRIVYINDAVAAALGRTPQQVIGLGFDFIDERLHPDDREGFAAHRQRVASLEDSEVAEAAFRFRHEDGRWQCLRLRTRILSRKADGVIREILGTVTDATDQSRAEEALRISEARYRTVSELTSDYSFSIRVHADGRTQREWITEAFSRITGYDPQELSELEWEQLVHADDHELRRTQFQQAIRDGHAVQEYRIHSKGGELRWIREHARVIHNDDDSFHWYGACRDITEQKLAENARMLSDERFHAITESSRDIVVEIDHDGNILYVSPNVTELTGYTPEYLKAKIPFEAVHPDDLELVTERVEKMMHTGEPEELLFRMRNSEGSWRWMETTATIFNALAGDTRAVMISRDISERLRIEGERRQLASVVENSSEFIAMLSPEGRILFLNEAGRAMVGLASSAEARSRSIFDCLAPEDAQDMRFKVLAAVAEAGDWEGDFRLRHLETGRPISTLAHVFAVAPTRREEARGVAIVARDISERITAERLLRESEARHRMLVESAYDLIAEFQLDGSCVYASPNFEAQLGYPAEEVLGTFWFDAIHPDDIELAKAAFVDLQEAENRECPPLRLRHRDGSWRWVETNLKKYENLGGRRLVLACFRDVTRRKLAEDALHQSRELLLQSQKLEAVGRLAGGVAHDFNNLLTAITGYCDLLLDEIGDAADLRADAEQITRAAERAAGLTRQLLAFSRRQVLLPKVLDLNALVSDVERLLQRLIGEDIELVTRLDPSSPRVRLDPGQLEQLVMNLAINARDAMPRGGRLTIATSQLAIPEAGDPEHPGVAAGRYAILTVEDTGVGMTPEMVSKIFEPFYTTKEAGKGTGLGLAMTYGIVQQSGGEIRVASQSQHGSAFTVYLPQVDAEIEAPAALPLNERLRGSETLLLVEDSETVRTLVRRSLTEHGYAVLAAGSGSEALAHARSHADPIDLLVTDVVMPQMDGHELAQRLRVIRPELKVLYMSGFSDDVLSRHGVDAGEIHLVQKPFAPADLLREIRRVLGDAARIGHGSPRAQAGDSPS